MEGKLTLSKCGLDERAVSAHGFGVEKLHVLNFQGRDPFVDYSEGLPALGEGHAPVNFHGYAAATAGVFASELEQLPNDGAPVLLLLRRRLKFATQALAGLADSRPVWVSWKETGTEQVRRQLRHWGNVPRLRKILAQVEGAICPVDWIEEHYREYGEYDGKVSLKTRVLPPPYPLGEEGWDLSLPWQKKRGILIGTREFGVSSRNHAQAVMSAASLQQGAPQEPVTVVNTEGRAGKAMLKASWKGQELKIVEGPLPYGDWLKLVAEHKLVWQLDDSGVPGQVTGDCLLAGTPCLGGQGMNDKLMLVSWRELMTDPYRKATPFVLASALLQQEGEAAKQLLDLWRKAGEQLSYAAFRRRWG